MKKILFVCERNVVMGPAAVAIFCHMGVSLLSRYYNREKRKKKSSIFYDMKVWGLQWRMEYLCGHKQQWHVEDSTNTASKNNIFVWNISHMIKYHFILETSCSFQASRTENCKQRRHCWQWHGAVFWAEEPHRSGWPGRGCRVSWSRDPDVWVLSRQQDSWDPRSPALEGQQELRQVLLACVQVCQVLG